MTRKKPKKESFTREFTPPKAKTRNQADLLDIFTKFDGMNERMVLLTGPAGTGKTYLTAAYAGYLLKHKIIDKIVITRPNVPTGATIGLLPGTMEEKMTPWVKSFLEPLGQYLGPKDVDCIKGKTLEVVPLEVIRGRTFDNCVIVLDEAQNTTKEEIKAFVTRQGKNTLCVLNGDITQSDIMHKDKSGLKYLLHLFNKNKSLQNYVDMVEFTTDDIVRSGITKEWVLAFDKDERLT